MHNSLYYLVLIILLLLMYESFQPTPLRASSQIREGLILLLFLVYFCVAGDCVCLYNHQSHIFDYFYMLLRDDCFLSIINRACVSLQFPIDDLYLPLWKCYIAISCDRVDRQRILCLSCLFCNFGLTQTRWHCLHSFDEIHLLFGNHGSSPMLPSEILLRQWWMPELFLHFYFSFAREPNVCILLTSSLSFSAASCGTKFHCQALLFLWLL